MNALINNESCVAHKIYKNQRITSAAVCKPHQKIPDFTPILKNSNCESCNLIHES